MRTQISMYSGGDAGRSPAICYAGRDPSTLLQDKQRYPVMDPWTGEFGAGTVRMKISNGGMRIVNVTEPDHFLYNGKVVRQLFQAPDGGWYVFTRGTGNNLDPTRAELNQLGGPDIFDEVDRQMRTYVTRKYRGYR